MGAGTFRPQADTSKHTSVFKGFNLNYAVSHMCGWRQYMKDAHLSVSPLSDNKSSLFAVFDGHGGAQVAIFAQRHFVQQLQLNKNFIRGDYELALRQTFFKIDQLMRDPKGKVQIKQIQKQMNQIRNGALGQSVAGCTANVWLITQQFIYVANARDSRGVICVNGKCQQMSKDHKPDDKQQLDRIIKAGGQVTMGRVNGNINLSRALGDFEFKSNTSLKPQQQMITANPDIKKIKNENIDYAIIGCDGIWQQKSSQQMINWISKRMQIKKPLGDILQQLLDELVAQERTMEAKGTDNMSAILIKFNEQKSNKIKKCNKDNNKTNDEIGFLLSKYLIMNKNENKKQKKLKNNNNDEMSKLLKLNYLK